jgi:ABC-type amino acid transport substrate-binding protein
LQSAKYTLLLMIGIMLTVIGCGEKKKEAPRSIEHMKKYNAVSIVTQPVNAPFEFGKDTGVQGLDIDIATEIAKTVGYEIKWIKSSKYEQLFDYLRSGEAEIVISAVTVDPKIKNEFLFSHPYYASGDVIAVQREKISLNSLASISGKNIGVAAGRPGDIFMSAQKDVTVKKYATLDEAMGGLNRAEVDAVVGDEPFIVYGLDSYPNAMAWLENKVNNYQYVVAVRKDETELMAKINKTIDSMKASGDIDKLEKSWMGDKRDKASKIINGDIKNIGLEMAPKTISVNINKVSGSWNPDRLDGFKLVFEGASRRYESSPILMDGNKGHCKFGEPVPPGDYKLDISILHIKTNITIPKLRKTALTMDLNIGNGASILFK